MRRHVHWILLLLAVPASYFAIMLIFGEVRAASEAAPENGRYGWGLLGLGLLVAAVVVPLVFLILAIIQMRRTCRRAQRARGKLNAYEKHIVARAEQAAQAWEFARQARADLLSHRVPPRIQQWDVVPYEGELFFARVTLQYARYYGMDVSYGQGSTVALGRPAFVAGALAVSAIANAAARSRAAAQAAPQWRERQTATVYISNRRLAVSVGGQWLSFDYAAMTAVYPEVASSTLVCQFGSSEPMLLSGDEAAIAAVFVVMQTYGVEALRDHPSLQALNEPAPEPTLPPLGRRG